MSNRRDWMIEARKRHNKSVDDVAADLGVSRCTIYRLEAGETDKTHADIIGYYQNLCQDDGVDIPDDNIVYKHDITAFELCKVVHSAREADGCSLSCGDCELNDGYNSCDYLIIADYLNKNKR